MTYLHSLLKRHGPGWLLMAASLGFFVVMIQLARAQTLTTLYSFTGGSDGFGPAGKLLMDNAGNLYGTTEFGGTGSCQGPNGLTGCGTVFKITPSGVETVLYRFTGGADGAEPIGGLVFDGQGNLYGTTYTGGIVNSDCLTGCGVVFEVSPSGSEDVLYSFKGGTDAAYPSGDLTFDAQGDLLGTTFNILGGGGPDSYYSVFKVTTEGVETVLYSFSGGADGGAPRAGLLLDKQGNIYGAAYYGGAYANGVLFEITASGAEKTLFSFPGGSRGSFPNGGLIRDAKGNLYGTTEYGGAGLAGDHTGCGVLFELTSKGAEKVLWRFPAGKKSNPCEPTAGLAIDATGNFYGTTYFGSGESRDWGTLFERPIIGKPKMLAGLNGHPEATVILDNQGNLYGTTFDGGDFGYGMVFKFAP